MDTRGDAPICREMAHIISVTPEQAKVNYYSIRLNAGKIEKCLTIIQNQVLSIDVLSTISPVTTGRPMFGTDYESVRLVSNLRRSLFFLQKTHQENPQLRGSFSPFTTT